MNIQQLEYIVAVDNHRHFVQAADACFVTQPTLSMMIQKLEEELDVILFDRSKHPVEPTNIGAKVIEHARVTLKQIRYIKELIDDEKNRVKGSFKLGVIPTIAPYLIPELLKSHEESKCPVDLTLHEKTTAEVIDGILRGEIDGAIVAEPLNQPRIVEYPLYYEHFYAYVSPNESCYDNKEIDLDGINIKDLWLLEEEHCLRGQIQKICNSKRKSNKSNHIRYEAGSIDTLISIIDQNKGLTIIPEMTAMNLSEERQENLRPFKNMTVVREICLVVNREYVRKRILKELVKLVRISVPKSMQNADLKKFVVDI
ncbi:MAG: hydrogen peroxide-inducible genes activator [Prevotellaceae bacterium]|jgi:LysR family hydrogen peroxide-inducible transcriptional activator|nr:hydrogen peroxide-inducible genes activator [Prevotellaceae bacterium]